ncbi:VOC family protein [Leptospira meyeri]|uniref:VOC family protein n=1 Tax=Leptospira meyeri TaxID=29508 RepID=UPI0002BEC2D0|nr:VOC family protein [Leptospira meyeri]EMJ89261.1 glyoxalase-like domain protein [Leptospira meyeri serovar Semaranga str. Veldrot Semarang 173]
MIIVEGIGHVSIPVSQLDTSIDFYRDIFDFEVEAKKATEAILSLDSFRIRLVKAEVSDRSLPLLSFVMDVDDFTEAISELEEKNVKIIKGPEGTDSGESLTFADPSQNLIEIFYSN